MLAEDPLESELPSTVRIGTLDNTPVIDGIIEEGEWDGAAVIDQPFIQFQPDYGQASPFRTVVHIAQTETSLFIAFEAWDPEMDRLSAARTQRDGGLDRDDAVLIMLDTFNDSRTAYAFATNALATQEDFRVADNGRTLDSRWDAAWYSGARRYDDRWVAELEIPFAEIRFSGDENPTWRMNLARTLPRRNEFSTWTVPSESVYRVTAFGDLSGVNPSAREDKWLSLIHISEPTRRTIPSRMPSSA